MQLVRITADRKSGRAVVAESFYEHREPVQETAGETLNMEKRTKYEKRRERESTKVFEKSHVDDSNMNCCAQIITNVKGQRILPFFSRDAKTSCLFNLYPDLVILQLSLDKTKVYHIQFPRAHLFKFDVSEYQQKENEEYSDWKFRIKGIKDQVEHMEADVIEEHPFDKPPVGFEPAYTALKTKSGDGAYTAVFFLTREEMDEIKAKAAERRNRNFNQGHGNQHQSSNKNYRQPVHGQPRHGI